MAFSFQVVADPSIDVNLIKDAQYALSQWSTVLTGRGTLSADLRVFSTQPVGRANNDTTGAPTGTLNGGRSILITSAAYKLTTGQHAAILPDGTSSDLVINFDPAYLKILFIDPNPSASSVVPPDKIDAVSVIEHEIGHGLGISGYYPLTALSPADLPIGYQSKYDSFVQFQNGQPFFIGPHAQAANNGNPVPLTGYPTGDSNATQNIYHLAGAFSNDLMTGSPYQFGVRYTVSKVDAGIIEDAAGLTSETYTLKGEPVLPHINFIHSQPVQKPDRGPWPSEAAHAAIADFKSSEPVASSWSPLPLATPTWDMTMAVLHLMTPS